MPNNGVTVFVFGTNGDGFHGAGSAGYAMFGVWGNKWRTTYVPMTNKLLSEVPNGTKGKYAVKGQARGLMKGLEGYSYGIQTVTRPGDKRSISLEDIKSQLIVLADIARVHPQHTFQMTGIGTGLAGYTEQEMKGVLDSIDWPTNVIHCSNHNWKNT